MAANASSQQYVNVSQDPALAALYGNGAVSVTSGGTLIIPSDTTPNIHIIQTSGIANGNTSQVQYNDNGMLAGDAGMTYDAGTDSLELLGNLSVGQVLTDNLLHANGVAWTFSGNSSNYSNTDVASYLPTYTGNLNVNKVIATLFAGSGANLTNINANSISGTVGLSAHATVADTANSVAGANVTGIVANATHATTAGTANAVAGANVTGAVSLASVANSVAGANVTGTVAFAAVANSVAGANVSGTVANATNSVNATFAGTVTTAAQPNITAVGTLTSLSITGNLSAGNIVLNSANSLYISGGSNGQVLAATGTPGVVAWSTPTTGTLQDVTTNGGNTTESINITNESDSTNYNNGALHVAGGVGVTRDLRVGGRITTESTYYAGHLADFSSWTTPKFIGRDAGATYIQGSLVNTSDTGSADWISYGDQSDDGMGWCDMGFTGTAFNDPNYTITKASDGYLFAQGMPDQGGNLVIATGSIGGVTHRDIIFATGGYASENEMMRLNHEDATLYVGGHGDVYSNAVVNLNVNGHATIGGNLTMTGSLVSSGASPAPSLNGFSIVNTVSASLGAVGNVKITGGSAGQVLTTDGAGNLSFTTVSSGASLPANASGFLRNNGSGTLTWSASTGMGSPAYSDVWDLSATGNIPNAWTSYSFTGNIAAIFGGTDITGLSAQQAYGKQVVSGSKTLIINTSSIQGNSYGVVIEFPSNPTVGDTLMAPSIAGPTVVRTIYKPASGQRLVTGMGGGGASVTAGADTNYLGAYYTNTSAIPQPICWVFAGTINSYPTWYQTYF